MAESKAEERKIDDRDAKRDEKREERRENHERREDDRDARRDDSREAERREVRKVEGEHENMAREDARLVEKTFDLERRENEPRERRGERESERGLKPETGERLEGPSFAPLEESGEAFNKQEAPKDPILTSNKFNWDGCDYLYNMGNGIDFEKNREAYTNELEKAVFGGDASHRAFYNYKNKK